MRRVEAAGRRIVRRQEGKAAPSSRTSKRATSFYARVLPTRLPQAAGGATLCKSKSEDRVSTLKAIRIDKGDAGTRAAYADFDDSELMDGDVTVAVTHSTVNYKDG